MGFVAVVPAILLLIACLAGTIGLVLTAISVAKFFNRFHARHEDANWSTSKEVTALLVQIALVAVPTVYIVWWAVSGLIDIQTAPYDGL